MKLVSDIIMSTPGQIVRLVAMTFAGFILCALVYIMAYYGMRRKARPEGFSHVLWISVSYAMFIFLVCVEIFERFTNSEPASWYAPIAFLALLIGAMSLKGIFRHVHAAWLDRISPAPLDQDQADKRNDS